MSRMTTRPPLTNAKIEALRSREVRYEVADPGCAGLRLRIMPTGTKVFRWYVTSVGKVVTLGPWARQATPGHLTIEEARAKLNSLKVQHRAGTLAPALAARPPRGTASTGADGTFAALARDFLRHAETKLGWRSIEEVRRVVERELVGSLGPRPSIEITSREVAAVIERVAARAPATASVVFSYAQAIFRYGKGRALVTENPVAGLSRRDLGAIQHERSRILSDDEIAAFWHALDGRLTLGARAGLRLLLLTGVRTMELLGARWDEFDFDRAEWTIPVERIKAKPSRRDTLRPWVVPLAPPVLAEFQKLHTAAEGSPYVFPSAITENGAAHHRAFGAAMRRLFKGPDALTLAPPKPVPHDLRRTFRSGLSGIGIPWHVAERCLNHSLGKTPDTYDRADYLPERRDALARWAAHVEKIVRATAPATAAGAR